jgi:polygalacturonase
MFGLCLPSRAAEISHSVFDPISYGARGDGRTNDGPAIQRAIEACALAGGGTVYLPPGDFASGTLVLKSNITLHLSPGTTLRASKRVDDYSPLHLIYAQNAENISIEGEGAIDGSGEAFWDAKFKAKEKRPSPLIELIGCRNIHIQDVRIRNLPGWGIHPWECDGVYIHGLSMITDMRGPNTDGIDPDCSRNVFISDCYIEGGDDAICLKTTKRLPTVPAPPCEHVVVNNCVLIQRRFGPEARNGQSRRFPRLHFWELRDYRDALRHRDVHQRWRASRGRPLCQHHY